MTYFQRGLLSVVCILLGFVFFPIFFLGGLIAWSVYRDIVEAPARRAQQAEIDASTNAPVSVEDIRWACESPAETTFLDAMVSAYSLQTGQGAIEGRGLRLRNQISLGRLKIFKWHASSQCRADFLVDDKLVVEIWGYLSFLSRGHSTRSPEGRRHELRGLYSPKNTGPVSVSEFC